MLRPILGRRAPRIAEGDNPKDRDATKTKARMPQIGGKTDPIPQAFHQMRTSANTPTKFTATRRFPSAKRTVKSYEPGRAWSQLTNTKVPRKVDFPTVIGAPCSLECPATQLLGT